jgi:hypothetical protein
MRNFPNHSEVKEGERLRSKRSLSTCRSGELYDTHCRRWGTVSTCPGELMKKFQSPSRAKEGEVMLLHTQVRLSDQEAPKS